MFTVKIGTPEKLTPSAFKPRAKAPVVTARRRKFPVDKLSFKTTARGLVIEFPLAEAEEIYGFGLQMKGFACRRTKKVMRANADPAANTGDSHAPAPFFVSTEGYGVCVDSLRSVEFYCGYPHECCETTERFVLKDSTEQLYEAKKSRQTEYMIIHIPAAAGVSLYIFEGDTITDVVSEYNRFSGGGCFPPMWGLGNTYRCYTKNSQRQIMDAARYFRENKLPVTCIGLEPGWQTKAYSCSFAVNEQKYPDFKGMTEKLKREHFRLNLWEHAFTHPDSPIYGKLKPFSGDVPVWNGLVPDFAIKEASDIFAEYHKKHYTQAGVAGFKLDECDGSDYTGCWSYPDTSEFPSGLDGEQMHNCFGVLYQQTILKATGSKRTYSQVRNSGAFASSYPFVLYSDLYDHKDFIRAACSAGLSGLLWCPEVREGKNREDLIRRLQTVVFSALSMTNGWYIDGIPWEQLSCLDEARELMQIRMSLIPYLYSAFYIYHTSGKPPVRPLVSDYTADENARACDSEYLLGDALLIAPMTADEHEREVYLPQGAWYDFWSGEKFDAGRHVVKTERIPVFVKSGALLPLAEPVEYVEPDTVFKLELKLYGEGGRALLVEDDGESVDTQPKTIIADGTGLNADSSRYVVGKVTRIV